MSAPAPRDGHPPAVDSKQLAKILVDLAPLLVFFVAYLAAGIYWATGALMAATVFSMIVSKVWLGRISATLMMTTVLVVGFGGLTLWLNDPSFIKMKPTMINLLFAVVLAGGLLMGRNLLKLLLGEAFRLTELGWRLLTYRWIVFFVALAVLNEIVWRNFSEGAWASFKVFGILPITVVFAMLQLGLIQRHSLENVDDEPSQ
ncbi:MAG: septation protein A [Hyphomicrobiaceae bacterium]